MEAGLGVSWRSTSDESFVGLLPGTNILEGHATLVSKAVGNDWRHLTGSGGAKLGIWEGKQSGII